MNHAAHIQQLSTSIVNKIAAGEVIERPASVVKELMENAVDAGATRIDVTLEKGGSDTIRVADNGCGISADQLELAVASHATSKINSAEDLFSVTTLGFRGEALASIAAVSRLAIRSRAAGAEAGAELEVVGGNLQPVEPCGCPVGTTMEVRNLFFNTPVRHKFLRTVQTEMGHASEAFTRLALAHPQIHFRLEHQGRSLHDLAPTDDIRDRVAAFFGNELADSLIDVESHHDDISLSGVVASPMHSRSHSRMQYLFLNGRAIRDRALQHALGEAYRGLLLTGRQPICFLRLDMPSELVDVNVHPTKQEVRFQDSSRLYSQLLGMLRNKFLTADLTARVQTGESSDTQSSADGPPAGVSELVDWAKRQLSQQVAGSPATVARPPGIGTDADQSLALHRLDKSHQPPLVPTTEDPAETTTAAAGRTDTTVVHNALQLHNRYLVVETDTGLEVIDQHALHERILYEQIREKVLAGAMESQKLLMPEPVDLSASEAAAVLDARELLAQLGMEVQPFGGSTVLVSSYPAMLSNLGPVDVLRDLAERLMAPNEGPQARDLLDDLLHSVACKAAVKYGDRLRGEEIDTLLAQRHTVRDQHHCPHGRPTTLVLSCQDLDRQFKRI